jgi:hypothetical protein
MEQLTPVGITVSGGNITGIGGTLGTVDNAIPRADSTGGYTAQGSDIVIDDASTATQNNVAIRNDHTGQTNSALVLTPKGTGAFIVGAKPDGTVTGGNARGVYGIDICPLKTAATNVASGSYSVNIGTWSTSSSLSSVAIGLSNTASGSESVSIGRSNSASTDFTVAIGSGSSASADSSTAIGRSNTANAALSSCLGGSQGLANRYGMHSHAAGSFAAVGDAQRARFVLRQATSSATPATLFLNGSSTRLTIPSNKVFGFTVNICGTKQGLGEQSMFVRKGYIKNVAGTTSLIGTIETIGTDIKTAGATTTDVALTADDTNDALQINVIGVTGENWRWVASVDAVEISY